MEKTKFIDWRTGSKSNWGSNLPEGKTLTVEQIQTGAILRIADATEAMARTHNELIEELDLYKRRYKSALESNARLIKQVSAYKGHLRKAKDQLNTIKLFEIFCIHKPSGKIGKYVLKYKAFKETETIQIELQSGELFTAPAEEFKKI